MVNHPPISPQEILNTIDEFIETRYTPKFETLTKRLEREKEAGESDKIEKTEAELEKHRARHERTAWLEEAAFTLIKQLQFGTHTSKGIHSSSRGDAINFDLATPLAPELIGSQAISIDEFDASGNAAALPVANFLRQEVAGVSLKRLIEENHPALTALFAEDPEHSAKILSAFQHALAGEHFVSTTSELNKQLLWPLSSVESIEEDNYLNIIPLYPSVLTHELYQKVQMRFSEENRTARENRRKVRAEQSRYFSIHDLAVVNIGGSNPQGVSQLNARQGGRHFLLSSTPPNFTASDRVLTARSGSLFNWQLSREPLVRSGFWELKMVIQHPRNDRAVRAQREDALGLIIGGVLGAAARIQERAPGWSKVTRLSLEERRWLDPKGFVPKQNPTEKTLESASENISESTLENVAKNVTEQREEQALATFATDGLTPLDIEKLAATFAHWVNYILQKTLDRAAKREGLLGDHEQAEWARAFTEALTITLRKGGEV